MSLTEQIALPVDLVGMSPISVAQANALLIAWGHNLGPVNRPFGMQAWALTIDGRPVAVAVSASAVSATAAGYQRGELVELARMAACEPWANRVMIRLWREVAARRWPYWTPRAAISYSQNARHDGRLYRFDGWTKAAENCGSNGGGAWSRKRHATDAVRGPKTLWLWRYDDNEGAAS